MDVLKLLLRVLWALVKGCLFVLEAILGRDNCKIQKSR